MSIPRHKENRGTLVTSLPTSKEEVEAREREAALDRLAEMDAELMEEILKDDE